MEKGRDKNFVSIWFWFISMLVMVIPVVNIFMTIIWAFAGQNESRKNYFKAVILMFLLACAFMVFLISIGMLPPIIEYLKRTLK